MITDEEKTILLLSGYRVVNLDQFFDNELFFACFIERNKQNECYFVDEESAWEWAWKNYLNDCE